MTTTPPETPIDQGARTDPESSAGAGPRVTGDEIRDLGRLRRSRSNRRIAGVAGGLARHLDIDPIIVRVALVVLAFFGGAGLLVYGVCWLIVPIDGSDEASVRLDSRSRSVALVIVGGLAVLALLGDSLGGFGFPWPLAVIGVVVLVITLVRRRDEGSGHGPGPFTSTNTAPTNQWVYPTPARPRRGGPVLFWYTLALIAIGTGVLAMVDLADGPVTDSSYPALALGVCGVMLVLGAFWGRAGGIIMLGLVSAMATAVGTIATEVDPGHIDQAPQTAASVQSDYQLDAGEIELDLTDVVDLEGLEGRTITLNVDVGRIAVVLPADIDVTIISEVSLGHRSILGSDSDGDSGRTRLDSGDVAPEFTLDVTVGLGEIEIIREGANR